MINRLDISQDVLLKYERQPALLIIVRLGHSGIYKRYQVDTDANSQSQPVGRPQQTTPAPLPQKIRRYSQYGHYKGRQTFHVRAYEHDQVKDKECHKARTFPASPVPCHCKDNSG